MAGNGINLEVSSNLSGCSLTEKTQVSTINSTYQNLSGIKNNFNIGVFNALSLTFGIGIIGVVIGSVYRSMISSNITTPLLLGYSPIVIIPIAGATIGLVISSLISFNEFQSKGIVTNRVINNIFNSIMIASTISLLAYSAVFFNSILSFGAKLRVFIRNSHLSIFALSSILVFKAYERFIEDLLLKNRMYKKQISLYQRKILSYEEKMKSMESNPTKNLNDSEEAFRTLTVSNSEFLAKRLEVELENRSLRDELEVISREKKALESQLKLANDLLESDVINIENKNLRQELEDKEHELSIYRAEYDTDVKLLAMDRGGYKKRFKF